MVQNLYFSETNEKKWKIEKYLKGGRVGEEGKGLMGVGMVLRGLGVCTVMEEKGFEDKI